MKAASSSLTPVLNAVLPDKSQVDASNQLYYILVMLCKESALTRIVNAGDGEGLEAWRKLYQHHEPVSATGHAGLLLDLLGFDFSGDIIAKIELFTRKRNQYETKSGDVFKENVAIGTVLRNMPEGALKQHLILNINKFVSWDALIKEIDEVRRAQAAAQAGPMPMAVDGLSAAGAAPTGATTTTTATDDLLQRVMALEKGKGKGGPKGPNLGKGGGKGKGAGFVTKPTTPCPLCGKLHWKAECWYNPANKGGGKGGGKQGGKGAAPPPPQPHWQQRKVKVRVNNKILVNALSVSNQATLVKIAQIRKPLQIK